MPRNTTATARPGLSSGRSAGRPVVNTAPVPFDRASDPNAPAYDALSADLAAAGRRARNRKAQLTNGRPDPAYAEALRGRLMQPAGGAAGGSQAVAGAPLAAASYQAASGRGAAVVLAPDALPGPLTRPRSRSEASAAGRKTASRPLLAVLGIGALIVAVLAAGLVTGRFASLPANRVGEAVNATLVRTGSSQPLLAGSLLMVGDEIRVGADGHATLDLGSSQARLAGGAEVRLNILSSSSVQLALLAGRAYHRVVVPTGGSYAIVTGPYTWTATGTAFDLDRVPAPTGGEQVTLLALEHGVAIDGPDVHGQVPEGSSATVLFGNPTSTGPTIGPIPPTDFSDPWLINNARLDESLGYPIGALAQVALAPNDTPAASTSPSLGPTESPSESPTDSPSAEPSPSDSPSDGPSPTPGLTPSPSPSAVASPSPTPTPTSTAQPTVGLSLTSCPGGVVMTWSKYTGTGFARYVTLRSANLGISATYPQAGTLVAATTTIRTRLSGADAGVSDGSTYFYRTLALDAANNVLAASPTRSALGYGQADLGFLSITGTLLSWLHYDNASCLSEYRLLYSLNSDPTLANSTAVIVTLPTTNVSVPAATGWSSGSTIYFRVQAVRTTALGSFVVGQSSNIQSYTYP